MLEHEQQLIAKYGKDAANKMRRHFSGLSIEERAKHVGLSTEYNIVFRNFSRKIHNTDYMEHLAERRTIGKGRWQHYQDVRDHHRPILSCRLHVANGMVRLLHARAHVFRSLGAVLAAVPLLQALGTRGD